MFMSNGHIFNELKWFSKSRNSIGMALKNSLISLDAIRECDAGDLPGLNQILIKSGSKIFDFAVSDGGLGLVGTLTAEVDGSGNVVALHDLTIKEELRGLGYGRQVVQSLVANLNGMELEIVDAQREGEHFWSAIGVSFGGGDGIKKGRIGRDTIKNAQGTVGEAKARARRNSESIYRDRISKENSEPLQEKELSDWASGLNLKKMNLEIGAGSSSALKVMFESGAQAALVGRILYLNGALLSSFLDAETIVAKAHVALNGLDSGTAFASAASRLFDKNSDLVVDVKEENGLRRSLSERLAKFPSVVLSGALGWSDVGKAIADDLSEIGLHRIAEKIKKDLVDKPSVQLDAAKRTADICRVAGQWLSDGAPAPAWACHGHSCVFFNGEIEHLNDNHLLLKESIFEIVDPMPHLDELEGKLHQALIGDRSLFMNSARNDKKDALRGLREYFEAMPNSKAVITRSFGGEGRIELSESRVILKDAEGSDVGYRYYASRNDAISEFWSMAIPRNSVNVVNYGKGFEAVNSGDELSLAVITNGAIKQGRLLSAAEAGKILSGEGQGEGLKRVALRDCMYAEVDMPLNWLRENGSGERYDETVDMGLVGILRDKGWGDRPIHAVFGESAITSRQQTASLEDGAARVSAARLRGDASIKGVIALPDLLRLGQVRGLVQLSEALRSDLSSIDKLIHPSKEGVEQFYKWFEGSSVVDSKGRPLVLFHGTNSDFNTFDFERSREDSKVFMSPSSKMASSFALYRSIWNGANVLPVFAKANVLVVNGDGLGIRDVERDFKAEDSLPDEGVYAYAKRKGLTGVCFKSVRDDVGPDHVGAQDVYAFFDGAEFKSAIGNSGEFNKDDSDVRFSFAGEKAKTVDLAMLAKAGEMERAGADVKQIWQETGFFRAPWDQKWRWELDDSMVTAELKSGLAPEVLDHQSVFNAYPALNALKVDLDRLIDGKSGGYSEHGEKITIDVTQTKNLVKTLLHEMQHAIQSEEGFAKGNTLDLNPVNEDSANAKAIRDLLNVDYVAKQFSVTPDVAAKLGGFEQGTVDTVDRWVSGGNWESNIAAFKYEALPALTRYWNSAGEVEARLVEFRMSLSAAERRAAFPLDQIDVPLNEILVGGKWLGLADDAGFDAEFEAKASIAEQLAAQNLGVPVRMVMEVARLSESELKDRDAQRTNLVGAFDEPKTFKRYPLGSAMVDEYGGDFAGRYVSYLREFEPSTLATSEAEERIKSHPTYAMYVKWSGDGIDPPYVAVNEGENGKLISTNRRRTLAAQETGRIIQGWFSPLNKVTGLPLKVADVHAAIEAAQAAIKAQPERAANGVIACVDYAASDENRETANLLKGGSSKSAEAVARAAHAMAEKVGANDILVPIPGRTGSATSTLALAQAIGDIAGCRVADILSGVSRESTRSLRYEGIPSTAKQMGFALKGEKPEGRIVLVDNVLATGTTVYAARKALGEDADVLVYAADSRVAYAPVDPDGEMDAVREKYAGTDMWLKAPNGDKSHLSERQWLMVRTPSFKSWFGDWENDPANASKAIGANGEPKVYYHGSDKSGFHEFETEPENPKTRGTGSFFTDNYNMAASYIQRSDHIAVHLPEDILESPDLIDAVIEKGILVDVEMSSGRIERCFYEDIDAALADLSLEEGEELQWVEGYQVLHDEEFIGTRGEVLEHLRGIESRYSGIYECFLNLRECMTYDWKGNNWDDAPDFEPEWCIYDPEGFPVDYLYSEAEVEQFKLENPDLTIEKVLRDRSTDDVAREARMSGDDGVLLDDVDDSGPYGSSGNAQVAVVFEAKNIKSAHNLGTFASTTNDIRFSFAGENASTVDLAMLAKAGEMERAGADVKEIWKETGFFRAPWDNKWRWEIDDSEGVWAQRGEKTDEYGTWPIYQNTGAVIDHDAAIAVANNERVSVDGVLWHEKLYAAYPKGGKGLPSLGKTQVRQQAEKGASYGGRYITVNKDTLLDHGSYRDNSDGRLLPEMLLHELQHSIQDREGFAKGGNPQQFDSKKAIWYRDCLWWRDQVETRAIEQGFGIDSYQGLLKANDLVYSEYVAAGLEDLALDSKTREDALQFGFSKGGALREIAERNVVMYGLDKSISPTSELAMYRRLAGEAEARLTMKRSKLSAAERRERFPLDDMDVPVEQLIVVGVENIQNEQIVTADTIDINGVQRPTRNSEGKLIHATTDGIKNFWAWFGDSKSVDEAGRPLVVYHGTASSFDTFNVNYGGRGNAIYTTPDKEAASAYAAGAEAFDDGSVLNGSNEYPASSNVMPLYSALKNPLILDEAWAIENMGEPGWDRDWGVLDNVLYDAEQKGYDGLILRMVSDFAGRDANGKRVEKFYDQHIVFKPAQLKSALGNDGNFSEKNNSISKNELLDAEVVDVDGVMRSTRNSEGSLIHPDEEGVRNFWRWFGNSKVVDKEGRPLVVYHGTTSKEPIDTFDRRYKTDVLKLVDGIDSIGTWFSDSNSRVNDYASKAVYPAYLKIENPRQYQSFDDLRFDWKDAQLSGKRDAAWKKRKKMFDRNEHHGDSNEYIFELEVDGQDGVIIRKNGEGEWKDQTAYVAINPEQIKSALGNDGNFNINDKSISSYVEPDREFIEVDGVLRRIKNSEGKLIHAEDEGVRNFWRWFGDSKAVDDLGRPLVVYHGTNQDFDQFMLGAESQGHTTGAGPAKGFFFSENPANASGWASAVAGRRDDETRAALAGAFSTKGNKAASKDEKAVASAFIKGYQEFIDGKVVYPAYVRLENPVEFDAKGRTHRDIPLSKTPDALLESAQKRKKDGVIIKNLFDAPVPGWGGPWTATQFAVLEPTQIKSAISNDGLFSNNDANIMRYVESEQSAKERFVHKELERLAVPEYKGREKVIEMKIDDFLGLASDGMQAFKMENAQSILDQGGVFSSIPYLYAKEDGTVVGHEGRHRAMALKAAGYDTMPVELRMSHLRWSQQNDPNDFDYVAEWPKSLRAQKDARNPEFEIPFPVSREQANDSYFGAAPAANGVLPDTVIINGVARATRNNEGALIHPTADGIYNFWAWYGDKGIVDDQGRPKVFYHGSAAPDDLRSFVPGGVSGDAQKGDMYGVASYFTDDREQASAYAEISDGERAGAVFPVYLRGDLLNQDQVLAGADAERIGDIASKWARGSDRARLAQTRKQAIFTENDKDAAEQFFREKREEWLARGEGMERSRPVVEDGEGDWVISYTDFDMPLSFEKGEDVLSLLDGIGYDNTVALGFDGLVLNRESGAQWVVHHRPAFNVKSALGNNGYFSANRREIALSFAGDKAYTADIGSLSEAKSMVDRGQDPEFVRRKTGWHQGIDEKWRFEISDHEASIKKVPKVFESCGVHEILDHEKLFAAYPFLREYTISVGLNKPDGPNGAHYANAKLITLTEGVVESDQLLSVLLHEIQHAIQSVEGFARGGNTDREFTDSVQHAIRELNDEAKSRIESWKWHNAEKMDDAEFAARRARYALMYESANRLVEYANRDKPSGVMRLIRNEIQWIYDPEFRKNDLARELQYTIYNIPKPSKMRERNQFLAQFALDAANLLRSEIPAGLLNDFRNDPRTVKGMINALQRQSSKASQALTPLRELEREAKAVGSMAEAHKFSTSYAIYKSLAGEVESRNTERRMAMDDEQRKARSPSSTEDVLRSEQIVVSQDMQMLAGGRTRLSYSMSEPYPSLPVSMQTQDQMIARGADGHLSKAWERYIEIEKIDGLEPTPAASDEEGYRKGRIIKQPIEVVYEASEDKYYLYGGNHRITQAKLNGDKFIRAFVQPDKGRIGKDATTSPEKAGLNKSGNDAALWTESDMPSAGDADWVLGASPSTINVDGVERSRTNSNGMPIHPTDEGLRNFWRWFDDSKAVDAEGRPIVLYHGTSKDKEFKSFKASERGLWFTSNPDSASMYAKENDSQTMKYEDGRFFEVNTAARVLPVYIKVSNVHEITPEDHARCNVAGYARAQAQLNRDLKMQGVDGTNWGGGTWVAFDPSQVKSAIGNVGSFDPKKKDIAFSFAGIKARTVDVDKLRAAGEMEKSGADAREIWDKTGFFRAPWDNQWRWEISDHEADLTLEPLKPIRFGGEVSVKWKMSEGIRHERLLAAYPELENLKFKMDKVAEAELAGSGANGDFSESSFEIRLREFYGKSTDVSADELDLAVINAERAINLFRSRPEFKEWSARLSAANQVVIDLHLEGAGEIEVDLAQAQVNILNAEYRDNFAKEEEKLVQALEAAQASRRAGSVMTLDHDDALRVSMHEMQHAIQGVENFGRGAAPAMFSPDVSKEFAEHMGEVNALFRLNGGADGAEISDRAKQRFISLFGKEPSEQVAVAASTLTRGQIDSALLRINSGKSAYEKYMSSGGEVEARLTEKRLGLNEEERRNRFPLDDLDVPVGSIRNIAGSEVQNGKAMSFGGVHAATFDPVKMLAAVEMENAGADARAIWAETGFFRAPWDKQWRFEIDDSQAAIKAGFAAGRTMPVSDALDHDELLKSYPAIGNIAVSANFGSAGSSWFDKSSNTAAVHLTGPDDEDVRTFIHEMQHAIQAAEQFASGGGFETKAELLEVIAAEKRRHVSFHNEFSSLHGEAGELKRLARVYDWLNLASGDGLITVGGVKRTQEWQERGSAIVNQIGEMPKAGHKRQLWLRDAAWHIYLAERDELVRDFGGAMRNADSKADAVLKASKLLKDAAPYSERASIYQRLNVREQKVSDLSSAEVYRRLAGEAEARLAEYRFGMNKEQRRSIFPLDQLDVSVNDLIVRTGDAGFSMSADLSGAYRIESVMRGVIGEQLELSLIARRNDNDAVVGGIDFSEYRGEVSVQMVNVVEDERRNGLATQLAAALQNAYPASEIDFGYLTDDGAKWIKSLPFKVIDSEHADDFRSLEALRREEEALRARIDDFESKKDAHTASSEDWKAELFGMFDKLNDIADEIYGLEESTRWVKPHVRLIDVDVIAGRTLVAYEDSVAQYIKASNNYKSIVAKADRGDDVTLDEYEKARDGLMSAEVNTKKAMAIELMKHGCVSGRNGDLEYVLHGSAKGDGGWQLTRLKNGMPIGDANFMSVDAACSEMLSLSSPDGLGGNKVESGPVTNDKDGLVVNRSEVVTAVREAFAVDVDSSESRIVVVQSISELPESLRDKVNQRVGAMSIDKDKGEKSPRGVVCEGMDKAYLIADGFSKETFSVDTVRRVVLHEGFHWLVGDGSDLLPAGEKIMVRVGELFDDGLQKISEGRETDLDRWVVSALSRVPMGTPQKLIVEEFAAHAVEDADVNENGIFQSWKDQFAAAALRVGFLPTHLDDKALGCLARFAVRELSGQTGLIDDVATKAIKIQRELGVHFGKASSWIKSIFGGDGKKYERLQAREGDVNESGLRGNGKGINPAPAREQSNDGSGIEWKHQEDGIILPPWVRRAHVAEGDCKGVMAPEVINGGYLAGLATRYLSELAQENLVALVLDSENRPITILRHSIGGVDSADVHAGVLLGAIKSIEGANSFWLAHNHPGGTMKLSAGDVSTMNRLGEMAIGSGIKVNGMLAVTDEGVSFAEYGENSNHVYSSSWVEDAVVNETLIHVSERVFGDRSIGEPMKIGDENDVLGVMRGTKLREGAFLLMNSSNVLLSVVPMPSETMMPMRNGGVKWGVILDEMSRSNASRAVVILDEDASDDRWKNALTALNCVGLEVANIYRLRKRESGWSLGRDVAAEGVEPREGGVFFSLESADGVGALRHQVAVGGQHYEVTAEVRNTVISELWSNVKARFASLALPDKSKEEKKGVLLRELDEVAELNEARVVSTVLMQTKTYDPAAPVASRSTELLGDLRMVNAIEAIDGGCINHSGASEKWATDAKEILCDLYAKDFADQEWLRSMKRELLSVLGAESIAVCSHDVVALNPLASERDWMSALEACGAKGAKGGESYEDRCDIYSLGSSPAFSGVSSAHKIPAAVRELIDFDLAPSCIEKPESIAGKISSFAENVGMRGWSVLSALGREAANKLGSVCDIGALGRGRSSNGKEAEVATKEVAAMEPDNF